MGPIFVTIKKKQSDLPQAATDFSIGGSGTRAKIDMLSVLYTN